MEAKKVIISSLIFWIVGYILILGLSFLTGRNAVDYGNAFLLISLIGLPIYWGIKFSHNSKDKLIPFLEGAITGVVVFLAFVILDLALVKMGGARNLGLSHCTDWCGVENITAMPFGFVLILVMGLILLVSNIIKNRQSK